MRLRLRSSMLARALVFTLVSACGSGARRSAPTRTPPVVILSNEAPTPTRLYVGGQRVCVERSNDTFLCSLGDGPWEEFPGSTCLDGSQQCRTEGEGVRCDWGEHTWFVPIEGHNLVCAPIHICATAADGSVSCEPFGMVGGLTAATYAELRILPNHAFSEGRPALAFGDRSACVRQHGQLRCWFMVGGACPF